MKEFLDFVSYFGGLLVGGLILIILAIFMIVGWGLLIYRLIFGESFRAGLNRRFPIPTEEPNEYS